MENVTIPAEVEDENQDQDELSDEEIDEIARKELEGGGNGRNHTALPTGQ